MQLGGVSGEGVPSQPLHKHIIASTNNTDRPTAKHSLPLSKFPLSGKCSDFVDKTIVQSIKYFSLL